MVKKSPSTTPKKNGLKPLKAPRGPKTQKPKIRREKAKPQKVVTDQGPGVKLQPHLKKALIPDRTTQKFRPVTRLSKNKVRPNEKMKKKAMDARLGSVVGLKGPQADFAAPVTRAAPRGVMDFRQLTVNTANNEVPDEFGITNKNRMPMQNIIPSGGGKFSGRTGPIR